MWELPKIVHKVKIGYTKLDMVVLIDGLMVCAENDEKLQQNMEW